MGMINRTNTQLALDGKALPALKTFTLVGTQAALIALIDVGWKAAKTGKKPTVNEFMGEVTKNTVGLPYAVGDITGVMAKRAFAALDHNTFNQDILNTVPEAGPRAVIKTEDHLLKAIMYYATKEREEKQPKRLKWKIEAEKAGTEIAKLAGVVSGVPQSIIKGGLDLIDVVNDID